MGHRANLIVVRPDGGRELYYSHWRANTLDSDLFFGSSAALAFIRNQRSEAEGAEWLDEVWAEGGCVLDLSKKLLLWFGGEDVLYDVPLRRVHLELMRELWPGWEIVWAHDHITALASYVGIDPEGLLVDAPDEDRAFIYQPEEPDWIDTVISYRRGGRWKVHAQDSPFPGFVLCGPALANELESFELPDRFDYAARSQSFPTGGIHVDADAGTVDVWSAAPYADFERRLEAAWSGWTARWNRDRFEAHLEILGDRVNVYERDDASLVAEIRARVERTPRDRSKTVPDLIELFTEQAEVNAFARRDDRLELPKDNRRSAFDTAVELRARRLSAQE